MGDDEMSRLLDAIEDRLGNSWVGVVEHLRETNQIDDIAHRLRIGDVDGAVDGVEQAIGKFASEVGKSYTEAAEAASAFVDGIKPGQLVSYNGTNARAADWAATNRAELVREVSQQTRNTISQAVSRGVLNGANPRDVARDVRDSIGLTEAQEQHVANYRTALEQGDWSNALRRELRDKRSDKSLHKLMRDGGELSPTQVDSMVDRYRAAYVAHRAETIARTEGMRALHQGVDEGFQQAIENESIAADELVQEWHSAGDPRVRDSHRHVVDEDGNKQKPYGIGYWKTGAGNYLLYPGDPSAPASEVVNCRCVVSTVVNPNEQATTTAPAGFDKGNNQVREGIPDDDNIRPNALYRVPIGDLRGKLIALPGVGEDEARQQSVRDAWADGKKLPPVKLYKLPNGDFYVEDGRHRLTAALEDDRDVLVHFDVAIADAAVGTVRLGG